MATTLDAPRTYLDNTVRVFDQFYNFTLVVGANQYEIINSYFYSVSNSMSTAKNFTTMLFRIASITGEDPLTLLQYIQGTSKIKTTALMAYYLNSIKSKTTLYGINNSPIPNENIQRNIVT